jgi:hypothetical protein
VPAFVLLLLLALPAAAGAQGRAAAGSGGVLPDLSAIQSEIDQVVEGPVGRAGKGLVGAAGLAAAVKYGAAAAFGAVSGASDPIIQAGVRGDGTTTGEPGADTSTSTSPATSGTSTQ